MKTTARVFSWLLFAYALALLSSPAGADPVFKSLYSFPATVGSFPGPFVNSDGAFPSANLVQGSDGNFYGTTPIGGSAGTGTVFKITSAGVFTTLYEFPASQSSPNSGTGIDPSALVQASDGDFYGTTLYGGSAGAGTVFKITSAGVFSTLYEFPAPSNDSTGGGYPGAALVQGRDANFYGTTVAGGANEEGTVFKITPAGTLTTLYSFAALDGNYHNINGAYPLASLVLGSDGNFYGTAEDGGSAGYGTVFKIVTNGTPTGTTLTPLADFTGANGASPRAALVEGNDGDFYGTTASGGSGSSSPGEGTVFKVTSSGELATLHDFSALSSGETNSDGASPKGALVLGRDGTLYGTAGEGGTDGSGTVFSVTPSGAFTALHSFDRTGGAEPNGLVQGADGNFYGTTENGGAYGSGTVFTINAAPQPPVLTSLTPASGPVGTVVTITGTNLSGVTAVRFHDANATVFSVNVEGTQITATVPGSALSGTIRVTTLDGSVQTATPFTVTASAAPSITSFSPSSGLTGTGVVITGTNLGAITKVACGGVSAAFVVDSPTQITAIVPNTVPNGAAVLTVASATVKLTSPSDFTVTGGAPIPVSISPASGPVGTVVTITGMRFDGVSAVRFHDADATVFSASADGATVTGTVPAGALSGTLKITTPLGTTQTTASFTVTP